MPKGKGLYTRKGARGRTMYFRDGKMISQKSYRASMTRRKGATPKRTRNRSPRKQTNRRKNNMARYRRPAMPHPSITGMASGLAVATYLDKGPSTGRTGGVIKDAIDGKLSSAFTSLSKNAISLASSPSGKTVLSSAIVLATAGAMARKWFPTVKLGGTKFYFKI